MIIHKNNSIHKSTGQLETLHLDNKTRVRKYIIRIALMMVGRLSMKYEEIFFLIGFDFVLILRRILDELAGTEKGLDRIGAGSSG